VHFGEIGGEVQSIWRRDLPLRTIAFLTDTLAIGGGYDNVPVVYECKNGNWEEKGPLDQGKSAAKPAAVKKSAFGNAFDKFGAMDSRGQRAADDDVYLPFRHQNVINDIVVFDSKTFSTSSADGRVLQWDVSKSY